MIIVLPNWTTGFQKKLNNLIIELCNKENINFGFVQDSKTIEKSIENITMTLFDIQNKAEGNISQKDHEEFRKEADSILKKEKEELKRTRLKEKKK